MSKFGAACSIAFAFLCGGQLFYCLYGSVISLFASEQSSPLFIVGTILGGAGIAFTGRYFELEYIQQKTFDNLERRLRQLDRLQTFIMQTVRYEIVIERFQKLKRDFAAECKMQVSFYARREKALTKALKNGSGDEALESYQSELNTFEQEDRLIRSRVSTAKEAFWNYHELVAQVNDIIDHQECVYDRPDSIKLGGQIPSEEVAEY